MTKFIEPELDMKKASFVKISWLRLFNKPEIKWNEKNPKPLVIEPSI